MVIATELKAATSGKKRERAKPDTRYTPNTAEVRFL